MREEVNRKMEICISLINESKEGMDGSLTEDVKELAFKINQVETQCQRNRLYFEKELDSIETAVKENSTQVPHSRVLQSEGRSKSPIDRSKVQNNSRSDKSLSRGKQNKSATAIGAKPREEELR